MTARTLLHRAVAAALFISAGVCSAQMGALRAGAAKADITPPKEMFPLKASQTYGSAHDPLWARALVVDNGISKVALISVDSTDIHYGDELISEITRELKIPAQNIILNATHDHNAPMAGREPEQKSPYFEVAKKGILEAARNANANLQPARVGFGTGKAYVNTNRDEKLGEGYHMGYAPEGPSDKTVGVLLFTKPTGEPIAVYTNYAVHAVVMFRTHTSEDGKVQVTSDIAGWTAKYVDDHFPGAVTVWVPGAAGDQNPLFQGDYNQDAPDVKDMGPGSWALLDVQSRRLGEEIVRVTKAIQNTSDRGIIWAAASSITCPGQKRANPPTPGVPGAGWRAPAPSTVKMVEADPVKIPLQLIMINDIALAGVGGEVFTEMGQHVKQDSLFDRTMMVTVLANKYGYIPTDKAYLLPSEKAVGNALKPGCAEPAMVKEFKAMESKYLPLWKAAK